MSARAQAMGEEPVHRARSCRCGASYTPAELARLELVRVIADAEIATLVVRWPENTVVDVRRCASCTEPMARLSRR